MEACGICALVTHSFACFLTRLLLWENHKLVGYIGAYTTLFNGITYTFQCESLHCKNWCVVGPQKRCHIIAHKKYM